MRKDVARRVRKFSTVRKKNFEV